MRDLSGVNKSIFKISGIIKEFSACTKQNQPYFPNTPSLPSIISQMIVLLLRPETGLKDLSNILARLNAKIMDIQDDLKLEVMECADILIKYEGYIERERQAADKQRSLEDILIPDKFYFSRLTSLSTESRQKFERIRLTTIGQAARISVVSPSYISILLVYIGR